MAAPAPSAPHALAGRLRLGSIEEQNAALGQHYDIEFSQLDPGRFRGEIDFLVGGTALVYRERYAQRIFVEASFRGDRFGVALQLACPGSSWWGEPARTERIPSLVAGESVSLAAGAGHDHLVLHLPHSRLLEAADRVGFGLTAIDAIRAGRSQPLLAAHPPALHHLGERLTSLLASVIDSDSRIPAAHLDELVLGSILSALDLKPARLRGAAPAAALVRRAIAAFDAALETAEEPPTITALCLTLRASPRTLEAAFRHAVGAGPHRFFIQRRLNRAFRLLSAAAPGEIRVSDVAARLGFTEFGRFAVRFRALFGESPSATLRRPRRRLVGVPSVGAD